MCYPQAANKVGIGGAGSGGPSTGTGTGAGAGGKTCAGPRPRRPASAVAHRSSSASSSLAQRQPSFGRGQSKTGKSHNGSSCSHNQAGAAPPARNPQGNNSSCSSVSGVNFPTDQHQQQYQQQQHQKQQRQRQQHEDGGDDDLQQASATSGIGSSCCRRPSSAAVKSNSVDFFTNSNTNSNINFNDNNNNNNSHFQGPPPNPQPKGMRELLEDEHELREFLKVSRPAWSLITKSGKTNIQNVMKKLRDIGVHDIHDLMRRVASGSINMDLSAKGHSKFSEETLAALRGTIPFLRALKHCREPHYRQEGVFAPVPLLLAKGYKQLWGNTPRKDSKHSKRRYSLSRQASESQRPATAPALAKSRSRLSQTSCASLNNTWRSCAESDEDEEEDEDGVVAYASEQSRGSMVRKRTTYMSESDDGVVRPPPSPDAVPWPTLSEADEWDEDLAELLEENESDDSFEVPERPTLRFPMDKRRSSSATKRGAQQQQQQHQQLQLRLQQDLAAPLTWPAALRRAAAEGTTNYNHHNNHNNHNHNHNSSNNLQTQAPTTTLEARRQRARSFSATGSLSASGTCTSFALPEGWCSEAANDYFEAEVEAFQRAVAASRSGPSLASWRPAANAPCDASMDPSDPARGLALAAKKVVAEAQALDEKENLFKQIRREGVHSATRKVITDNIRTRLEAASEWDKVKVADVHHRCTRIQKNLEELKVYRKDLRTVKKTARLFLTDPDELFGLRHFRAAFNANASANARAAAHARDSLAL